MQVRQLSHIGDVGALLLQNQGPSALARSEALIVHAAGLPPLAARPCVLASPSSSGSPPY